MKTDRRKKGTKVETATHVDVVPFEPGVEVGEDVDDLVPVDQVGRARLQGGGEGGAQAVQRRGHGAGQRLLGA